MIKFILYFRKKHYQSFVLITLAGTPKAVTLFGIDLVKHEEAPRVEKSPIFLYWRMVAEVPIKAPLPIITPPEILA